MILYILIVVVLVLLVGAIMLWKSYKGGVSQESLKQLALLALACAIMMGSACNYDFPSAVSRQMQAYWHLNVKENGESNTEKFQYRFNLLYSIYSLPNIVIPIYAGSFISRVGFNNGLLILVMAVFLGVFVYACGLESSDYEGTGFNVLILGRLLLGLGSETLLIIQSSLLAKTFLSASGAAVSSGISLSFAMAIALSIGRLNSVLDYNLLPQLSLKIGLQGCAWFIVGISALSVIAALFIVRLNQVSLARGLSKSYVADPQTQEENNVSLLEVQISKSNVQGVEIVPSRNIAGVISDPLVINTFQGSPRRRPGSLHSSTHSLSAYKSSTAKASNSAHPLMRRVVSSENMQDDGVMAFWKLPGFNIVSKVLPAHILTFPINYWFTIFILLCLSTATISFLPMATPFIEAKFFFNDESSDGTKASSLVSIPDTLSVISMPIIAFLADRGPAADTVGSTLLADSQEFVLLHRQLAKVNQLIMSGFTISLAHMLFWLTSIEPSIILLCLGAGYSSFGSVIYSLMAETIQASTRKKQELPQGSVLETEEIDDPLLSPRSTHDAQVASAYGLATCLVNATFFTTPLVVAWLMSIADNGERQPNQYNGDYDAMLIFYMILGLIGTGFSVAMRTVLVKDMKQALNLSNT